MENTKSTIFNYVPVIWRANIKGANHAGNAFLAATLLDDIALPTGRSRYTLHTVGRGRIESIMVDVGHGIISRGIPGGIIGNIIGLDIGIYVSCASEFGLAAPTAPNRPCNYY